MPSGISRHSRSTPSRSLHTKPLPPALLSTSCTRQTSFTNRPGSTDAFTYPTKASTRTTQNCAGWLGAVTFRQLLSRKGSYATSSLLASVVPVSRTSCGRARSQYSRTLGHRPVNPKTQTEDADRHCHAIQLRPVTLVMPSLSPSFEYRNGVIFTLMSSYSCRHQIVIVPSSCHCHPHTIVVAHSLR